MVERYPNCAIRPGCRLREIIRGTVFKITHAGELVDRELAKYIYKLMYKIFNYSLSHANLSYPVLDHRCLSQLESKMYCIMHSLM
jgi:hypothetical protein